jgi:hypothetical protein
MQFADVALRIRVHIISLAHPVGVPALLKARAECPRHMMKGRQVLLLVHGTHACKMILAFTLPALVAACIGSAVCTRAP